MSDQVTQNAEATAKEIWSTPEIEVLATTEDIAGGFTPFAFEDFTNFMTS